MYRSRGGPPFSGSASSTSRQTSTTTGLGLLGGLAGTSSPSRSSIALSDTSTLINNYPSSSALSPVRAGAPDAYEDIDAATSALIASLLYSDLQEIQSQRKLKHREGTTPNLTDAEYALQLQSEQLEGMLTRTQDADIARRMQDALRLDQELISQMVFSEKVAQQDREAALALERGQPLPTKTKEQLAVERGLKRDDNAMSSDILDALSPKLKSMPVPALDKGKAKATSPSSNPSLNFSGSVFHRAAVARPQCVGCDDRIPVGKLSLKAPCDHHYCMDCLANLVRAATSDESLFPVRCCRKNIPTDQLAMYLSNALLTTFRAKAREFGTPANARVYCHIPTCSAFLGNAEDAKATVSIWGSWGSASAKLLCDKCRVETCVDCRQRAHPNDTCARNASAAEQQVKDLARAQGWQTCPACKRIIELAFGCNHMTCYCGYEFCYECAAKWKTCHCEQWQEERLYATAAARMERELGAEVRVERPVEFQREVHAFAQNLRVNHECYPNHRWRGHGPGECEECGMYMPVFLKMCKDCMLTVCRRCSYNRI